nr:MAG TPA: hypothetical protein [Bacteriophage sp.]
MSRNWPTQTTTPHVSLLVASASCGKVSTASTQIPCATFSTSCSRASSKSKLNSRHPRLSSGMRTREQLQASRKPTPRRCPAN